MRDCSNPRRAVDVRPAIISASFACVNRHTHAQRNFCRPSLFTKRSLKFARGCDGIACSLKNREDTVAFPALKKDRAMMSFDGVCNDFVVTLERGPGFVGMRLPRASRSFYVGEQKRYFTDRTRSHSA